MAVDLRPVTEDEYPAFVANLELTFGFDRDPEEDRLRPIFEFDRAIGHFDGDQIVSTLGAFSLQMSVPGAVLPCGGTSVVTVAPTHRRSGLLRELMTRLLQDVQDRGEPMAALWASESEIYGRFGYGHATDSAELSFHRLGASLSRHAPQVPETRWLTLDEARQSIPQFHDAFRTGQPGMFARSAEWWNARVFTESAHRNDGATDARWVVVDGDGGIDGYVRYRVKSGFGDDGHFGNEVQVVDLFANTPAAWAGLWSYILSQDLATKVVARLRSPQDPVFGLLAGRRRAKTHVSDGLWLRLVDIPSALSQRRYSTTFSGVFEVHDPMGMSGGRFRLDASSEGATCESTSDDPDITLDIEDLGASFLGNANFFQAGRAGRLTGDTQTLKSADLAFSWSPRPWCPEIF